MTRPVRMVPLEWKQTADTFAAGLYRFSYFGDSKPVFGKISAFVGTSSDFTVS